MAPRALPIVATGLALCALAAPGRANTGQVTTFPFPMDRLEAAVPDGISFSPRAAERRALRDQTRVVLAGLPLPDGSAVDLDLRRVDLEAMQFGIRVDGNAWPDALEALEISLWSGTVVGAPGSEAFLSLSAHGSRGWVRRGGELVHLLAGPGPGGDWSDSRTLAIADRALAARGHQLDDFCRTQTPDGIDLGPLLSGAAPEGAQVDLLQCSIAVETDYQLFQQFGTLASMTTYVTTLLGAVSDRYQEEIDVIFTFPYLQFYTTPADPWSTPDSPGSNDTFDLINEFAVSWSNNIPLNCRLGHFISGASLGGGLANLGVVCNQTSGFAVSTGVGGGVQFPVTQGFGNWDFVVIAHELGHNFATSHTHNYCPPIDSCAPPGYFGSCQSSQQCISNGTLMSYCHLCSGGISNITTYFHPTVKNVMRNYAVNSCLPVVQPPPPDVQTYCIGKVNTDLCVPYITFTGTASASDSAAFVVRANDVIPDQAGLLVYGMSGRGNIPYHFAKLCVKAPMTRLLPPKSTGSGSGFCPGFLKTNFNNRIQSGADPALTAGQQVNAQWIYRDPGIDTFGDGLSDGVEFLILP